MFIFLLVVINLPTFKSNKIKYISVEIFDTKTEKLISDTVEKPVSPEIEPIKQEISPPMPINKPTPIKKNIPEAPENKPISIPEKIPNMPTEKPEIKNKPAENINDQEILNSVAPDLPPEKPTLQKDVFDDMLKNLAEEEPNFDSEQIENIDENIAETKKSSSLTPHTVRTIFSQIKENYEFPPAMEKSEAISVKIRIYLRTDGTIQKIVRDAQSSNNIKYLAYMEAAERALRKLEKFDGLPPEEYSMWKFLEIDFYPYDFNEIIR